MLDLTLTTVEHSTSVMHPPLCPAAFQLSHYLHSLLSATSECQCQLVVAYMGIHFLPSLYYKFNHSITVCSVIEMHETAFKIISWQLLNNAE